jgi:glycosyltransferase involved in cell wall biosynthesis
VLTILSVAYPLARVGADAVGGAEQVLTMLDAAIDEAGHRSLVIACEGSQVAGELIAVAASRGPLDGAAIAAARARHRRAIADALRRERVDLVHMHGVDFDCYLPAEGVPVLATLHCPPAWYSAAALRPGRPGTYLNAVSTGQHLQLMKAPSPNLVEPIENGVPLQALAGSYRKRPFALMLSRIAPEKGVHLAVKAARAANVPLVVAGELFPYPEHSRYFKTDVEPLLDRRRRYIGPVGFAAKRRLLAAARCLLVCSQVAETNSLAAREAMGAGTPVVALRCAALSDLIEDGRTGLLVEDEAGLADALTRVRTLNPSACRRAAEGRFDARAMTEKYLRLYERLAGRDASARLRVAGAA